jgi:hypothetical protein
LQSDYFIFSVFRPENACQVPEPPNPLPSNDIRLQVSYAQSAIMNT